MSYLSRSVLVWNDLILGAFVTKVNRFAGTVIVNGVPSYVYISNPTLTSELLKCGTPVLMQRHPRGKKTAFRLIAAKRGKIWATLDTAIPNLVFREAVRRAAIKEFSSYRIIGENVRFGRSLIDFLLVRGRKLAYVEVKSCTLVEKGIAKFPDAVTKRGLRHLRELEEAVKKGNEAYMVWVIQRPDAKLLVSFWEKDPEFSRELIRAERVGVSLLAYKCHFDGHHLTLLSKVPVVPTEDRQNHAGNAFYVT